MLVDAIEQSDKNKKPVFYPNKTVRQFINEYEALIAKEKSTSPSNNQQSTSSQDSKTFQFSRQYRPLIKILAERQKVVPQEPITFKTSSTQTSAEQLIPIIENVMEEDASNKSLPFAT